MNSTGITGNGISMTVDDVKKAIDAVSELNKSLEPKNKEWFLVTPDGKVYKGNIELMMRVMVQHHPLFKIPLSIG